MKRLINWFKTLFRIVKYHNTQVKLLQQQVDWNKNWCSDLSDIIKERTEVHADIHMKRGGSYAIMIGAFKGKSYVRTFPLHDDSFGSIVEHLRETERYARIRHLDTPPLMSAVFDHEFEWRRDNAHIHRKRL